MKLVKVAKVVTDTVTIRVPVQIKAEFESLRKLAKKHDVDFTATLAQGIEQTLKEIRGEIEALDRKVPHPMTATVNHKAEG